ncbi:uncharacterized protein LOC131308553 [Rhododendron vialii]|uniref:uncharacterized protein LOC131308553 n=1 Tax=Rhododendron vialii TaxID=182163 RepID=UPI002660585B|nr:uncharacterized protein LOC131308553 [Rhododendron vialii]
MPFGLRNARGTYKRLVTIMLKKLLSKTMEVYIGDMVVKSKEKQNHIADLKETFEILRKYRLKLNALKCAFGVSSGKFLGHLVTIRGIKANPDQIMALQRLQSPRMTKEVQRLTGMVAALNRFISWSSNKCRLFFQLLNKREGYEWGTECEQAFQDLKKYLVAAPLLLNPDPVIAAKRRFLGMNLDLVDGAKLLVVNQLSGEYKAQNEKMAAYVEAAKDLLDTFKKVYLEQISSRQNAHADSLAWLAAAVPTKLKRRVAVDYLTEPSIGRSIELVLDMNQGPSWMDPIVDFLRDWTLPSDKKEAHKIKTKSTRFWLSPEGKLYRKSFTSPYLLCVHLEMWGMDIVGPLHKATRNQKFLLVAIDYFTKWIAAEPLAKITEPMIEKFVWKSMITRFGVPYSLIMDNGAQFQKKFKAFCSQYGIRNYYSTLAYPQSNGQAEASNKTILDGIKKMLDKAEGKWPDELSLVLWAHRTTPRRSTAETPYSFACGTKAVIPLEVGLPTNMTALVESAGNDRALEIELDLAEERREQALVHLASYQEQLMKSYKKHVHPRKFRIGDLELRKVLGNTKVQNEGKLGANWKGPYRVTVPQ